MSLASLEARRRAVRADRRLLFVSFVAVVLLAVLATRARGQTPVVLQPGQSVNVSAAKAVVKTDTLKQCYTAQLTPITCPTTPPPIPTDSTPKPPVDTLPPVPCTPSCSHEPAGMTTITERPFGAWGENGWQDFQHRPSYAIAQDATDPCSPNGVIKATYPAGYAGGTGPGLSEKGLGSKYSTLYLRYCIKYSDNYQGHGSSANKVLALISGGENGTIVETFGQGSGPLVPGIAIQCGASSGSALKATGQLRRGQWDRVEVLVSISGNVDLWLNGAAVGHWTGKRLCGTTFNVLQVLPIWGGTQENAVATMSMSLGHLYVSGK